VERGDRVSIASGEPPFGRWNIADLTEEAAGLWEPSYDTALWRRDNILNLYVQRVGQGDGESLDNLPPQMVYVLEWKPE
jgi:hypothetical protein